MTHLCWSGEERYAETNSTRRNTNASTRRQAAGARHIAMMNTETVDRRTELAVAEFLKQMKKRAKRGRRTLNTALFLLFAPFFLAVSLILFDGVRYGTGAILLMLASAGVTLLYSLICLVVAEFRGAAKDIEELERVCGVKAIGPLLEMRNTFLTSTQQKAIFHALIRLLPTDESKRRKFADTEAVRIAIYSVLKSGGGDAAPTVYREPFRHAILKALEQVGDERAIPAVQRIASTPAFLPAASDDYRAAAERCLPLVAIQSSNRGSHQNAAPRLLRRTSGAGYATASCRAIKPDRAERTPAAC